jgi:rhodanese-related sulfurtransferase
MPEIAEIEPAALKARLERGEPVNLLDVREPEEIAIARMRGAVEIPMGDIPSRMHELDRDAEWVVICHHGMRSAQVAIYLARNGFERVANLIGGIDQWAVEADPTTPRY